MSKPAPETIIGVAFRLSGGAVLSMEPPARHQHLVLITEALDKRVGPDDQGFLTDRGRFVERREAGAIAIRAGQITKLHAPPRLFSEDLW